jgi:hypothetical protein
MFSCRRCGAVVNPQASGGGPIVRCFNCGENYSALAGHSKAEPDKYPYESQAPRAFASQLPTYLPQTSIREIALTKVDSPALVMMAWGSILVILTALFVLCTIAAYHDAPRGLIDMAFVFGVFAILSLVAGAFLLYAGYCLRHLRSYGVVLAGIVFGIAVSMLFCMPLTALGIWPLITICDPQVKQAFQSPHP